MLRLSIAEDPNAEVFEPSQNVQLHTQSKRLRIYPGILDATNFAEAENLP